MKHIHDPSFRYRSSFDTDVRKTFERVRRRQVQVLADTGIRGADLDEAKAAEALRKALEARGTVQDKQQTDAVERDLSMLAAQFAAIRRLRKPKTR